MARGPAADVGRTALALDAVGRLAVGSPVVCLDGSTVFLVLTAGSAGHVVMSLHVMLIVLPTVWLLY